MASFNSQPPLEENVVGNRYLHAEGTIQVVDRITS